MLAFLQLRKLRSSSEGERTVTPTCVVIDDVMCFVTITPTRVIITSFDVAVLLQPPLPKSLLGKNKHGPESTKKGFSFCFPLCVLARSFFCQ
jgi:hypothetical protein